MEVAEELDPVEPIELVRLQAAGTHEVKREE
jgi:hypothetical protein